MIAGFIIQGNASKAVLLRGIGPSLAAFGITMCCSIPSSNAWGMMVHCMTNDDWIDSPQRSQFEGTSSNLPTTGSQSCSPRSRPKDITAILTGSGRTTGVGLVEVYDTRSGGRCRAGEHQHARICPGQ